MVIIVFFQNASRTDPPANNGYINTDVATKINPKVMDLTHGFVVNSCKYKCRLPVFTIFTIFHYKSQDHMCALTVSNAIHSIIQTILNRSF